MITILQETTKWDLPNGIYHVNASGYLVAYQAPRGTLKTFKNPLKNFSKARRKFKQVGEIVDPNEVIVGTIVIGSKGQEYVVHDGTCTCPGFKFRGKCRHLAEAEAAA